MDLSALREELTVWRRVAASGGSYDMNRMVALSLLAIRREEARERGMLCAPAAMSNAAPRASTALTTSSPMSYTISPGDNRSSWPPEPVPVPQPPTPVLDELRRALRTVRDEEESDALCTIPGGGRVMQRAAKDGGTECAVYSEAPRRPCCMT
eukprot:6162924-Pleurochrysis_carterae.AAC.1